MDPLSLSASIIAVLQLTSSVIEYLNAVRDAPKDRAQLAIEAANLYSLFIMLRYRLEEGRSNEAWYASIKSLSVPNGPLDQYKVALEQLEQRRSGKTASVLLWRFRKEEIAELLARMESLKSLIQIALQMDHFKLSQATKDYVESCNTEISRQLSNLSESYQDYQYQQEQRIQERLRRDFCEWLSPCNPEGVHLKACDNHHEGTNGWFLDGPLKNWIDDASVSANMLLLKGTSGTGKSVLISQAIEMVQANPAAHPVAYFYCSFDDLETQDPINILTSWLVQLSRGIPGIFEDLLPEYLQAKHKMEFARPSRERLELAFIRHVKPLQKVFIFLDAINECQNVAAAEDLLLGLCRRCKNLRMIVTSTRQFQSQEFESTVQMSIVTMDFKSVNGDISAVVNDFLATNRSFRNVNKALKAEIHSTVLNRAEGMFRFANWLLTHLAAQRTGTAMRMALSESPRTLNETYAMLLSRLPESSPDRNLLRRCLLWLSFASRPLKLSELAEAVIVKHNTQTIDSESKLLDPEILLDISQGLFDLGVTTGRVTLAHSTVQTFLLSDWIKNSKIAYYSLTETAGHKELLRLCLQYLSLFDFKEGCGQPTHVAKQRFEEYPLLQYAARYWTLHAKRVDPEDWKLIKAFLETRKHIAGGQYGWWLQCIGLHADKEVVRLSHPLYYAASFGLTNLVKAILDNDKRPEIDTPGGRFGSTPLQVACFRKHQDIVALLIEAGADPFSLDGSSVPGMEDGFSAYFWAKVNGWDDIVKLMEAKRIQADPYAFQNALPAQSVRYVLAVQQNDSKRISSLELEESLEGKTNQRHE